jgi:peptide/nickel transport system substrate-binding protein
MHIRRPFFIALGFTILLVAILTACDLGTATEPATPTASAAASPAATALGQAASTPSPAETPTEIPPTPTPAETPTPSPAAQQGGTLTLRIDDDVEQLRPWDLNSRSAEYVADLMYNGLVRLDPQGQPQPDLAEEWEVSPDGGVITFTLRDDVRWHDGEPFAADDVAWTFNMLRTITPTTSLLYDLRTTIGQVEAPLTQTVVLSLTQPYAPLMADLAVPILPRHRLQDRSPEQLATYNFWDTPVGTGPFKYDRREADQAILFTRNDTFYRGEPYLERAALLIAPDPAVAAAALRDEELLLAEFGDATEPFTEGTLPVTITQGAYVENGWYGVVFNVRPERIFADVRVRQALAQAVDIPALVQEVTAGSGAPIATTILSNTWAYPADLRFSPPNLDAARALLEEAGWTVGGDGVRQKDGQPLSVRLWVRGDDPRRVAAAERIAEAARQIGMAIEVVPSNFDTVILAKLAPPYDFDILLGSWVNAPNTTGFPTNRFYDPDDYALFHSSRVWQGDGDTRTALRNVGGFQNAEYDAAAETARSTYDVDERASAIAAAQSVLQREKPYLFLWSNRIPVALNERVQSAGEPIALDSPRYLWNVEGWYLEQDEE